MSHNFKKSIRIFGQIIFVLLIFFFYILIVNKCSIEPNDSQNIDSTNIKVNIFDMIYGSDLEKDSEIISNKYKLNKNDLKKILFITHHDLEKKMHLNFNVLYSMEGSKFVSNIDSTLYRRNYTCSSSYYSKLSKHFKIDEEIMKEIILTYQLILYSRHSEYKNDID
ncbi:MAG: hypothetical protein P9M11_06960 [Candidatus Tenebribacter burtonii]|jgi:hypothetical protein|nr:hypothetical protein [Candidatus Tenebribacter burtonii]